MFLMEHAFLTNITVNILIDTHTLINVHPRKIGKNQPIFSTMSEKIRDSIKRPSPISKKFNITFQTFYPLQYNIIKLNMDKYHKLIPHNCLFHSRTIASNSSPLPTSASTIILINARASIRILRYFKEITLRDNYLY